MTAPIDLLEIFEARLRALGKTQADLELEAFGKPGNTFIQNLKRGASPGYDRVKAAADALGLELYLGMPRDRGFSEPAASDFQVRRAPAADEPVLIPPWRWPEGKAHPPQVAFTRKWVDAHGIPRERLASVESEPSPFSASRLPSALSVVDMGAPKVGGSLWAYRESGRERIDQLVFLEDGQLIILPDRLGGVIRTIRNLASAGVDVGGKVLWTLQSSASTRI